jgi:hypothetical protein
MDRWLAYIAELVSIFYAVNIVFKLFHQRLNVVNRVPIIAAIIYDSKSAFQAI